MPTVQFEGNLFGPDVRIEVPEGGRLIDVCDRAQAPVPFSCRGATCGTCRVEVLEGAELLEPREGPEAELHTLLADPPNFRLACQAKLGRAAGLIRLRIAGDEI
jgi:2Fe-2S ferredoxin